MPFSGQNDLTPFHRTIQQVVIRIP